MWTCWMSKSDQQLVLDAVLLLVEDEKVLIGTPMIKGARLPLQWLIMSRVRKLTIFKYRPRNGSA